MKEHIEHQIIKKDGNPLFVIVPYDEYLQFKKPGKKVYFPHEVVEKSVVEEKGLVRAWREYKGISQGEMAKRMGITQAAYSQMEKPKAKLRKNTLARIATALGVDVEQLHM
jgi:DNA-binding XRE family transcriptional regulator